MTPKQTDSELREEVEKHLDNFYGDDFGQFLPFSKTRHVADYFQHVLHQREQQIYAELMEEIESRKSKCEKLKYSEHISESPEYFEGKIAILEDFKTIINNIFKYE